jgi:hypothetical protein
MLERHRQQTSQFKRGQDLMRTRMAAVAAISFVLLGVASPASAFEGGGRKPSEAPLITVGHHYTGQLNNHENDANYSGYREVALWRLPPVTTRDVVTVDWHSAPFTHYSGFPICLILAQGVDDFSWGSVFGSTSEYGCDEDGPVYSLSGSGSAKTAITAQETNANSSYLEFFSRANQTEPASFETYPYDFTVEPILHYLDLAIKPVTRVSANGTLRATANTASGLPAPDGLAFNLAVTWPEGGIASYTGVSSAGVVSFQLALPETAYGRSASFVASHPADGTYQGVSSTKLRVKVAKPKATAPSPCFLAQRHKLALTRQYKRLLRHARRAHGLTRAVLRRRAARVKHKLHAARLRAKSVCGTR